MITEQFETDALLDKADRLAATARQQIARAETSPAPTLPPLPKPPDDPQLARILKLHVPVIVQLAQRPMPIASVRGLSVGAIIEFDKSVDEPLALLINNRLIGRGVCVKIGENFGLRITEICGAAQRIRSLGGE